ncbi:RIP metalloprotease RseP [Massilia violaceinigra]|uniref:Zinc metalloprotease n=1 Tax=Massilia violaceinigra TaxID=2045208 RepID=A0ABY4A848_9BURK|nr:RIP metalloprotease RseP [Massilia violaceinigra]UOD29741.1 RIP metalloprotease RseP [Massilia violaceinigra]
MNFFTTPLAFLCALGPLIILHELGHYLVARLCGVKVLRFSLGFGKVIWSRRFGPDQTEWVISMLPLGGYVRMLDDRDPATRAMSEADQAREFTRKSVWQRIAIVAAGPVANFLVAIAVFGSLYMVGMDEIGTRVRAMEASTPAYQAGLRGGDRIVAVNGEAVATYTELRWETLKAVFDKGGVRLDVVQQGGARYSATLPPAALAGKDVEGDVLGELGIAVFLSPVTIGEIPDPAGPAARAGMQPGDRVISIDGKPVADGAALMKLVGNACGRTLEFVVERAGRTLTLAVTPELNKATNLWRMNAQVISQPEMVEVALGPIDAIAAGARSTWQQAIMSLKMIGKMVTGQISLANLTGVVTIADYAGKTARMGPEVFLSFIAVVSVSLGVMNLLPIPVLDGGLLLYYSLEVLTGRRLPDRVVELAQSAGVVFLVMLMALALYNDVNRLTQPAPTPSTNTYVRCPND